MGKKYHFDLSKEQAKKLDAYIASTGKQFASEVLRDIIVAHLNANPPDMSQKHQLNQTGYVSKTPVKREWICVRGLPQHSNPAMQTQRCNACKVNHWTDWKACQELKAEQRK